MDVSGPGPLIVDIDGSTTDQIITLIRNLEGLSPVQRGTLIVRYKSVERMLKSRAHRHAAFFHVGRFTVTVGSLLVPALISIQNTPFISSDYVYWSAWIISLLVSICNGLISLMKIDKKYYFLYCVLEMLHSETWQYLALSGRYSDGCHGYPSATHQNQYVYFFHALERIKVKQVEEEYYKLTDMHNQSQARKKGTGEEADKKDGSGGVTSSGSVGIDIEGLNIPTPAAALAQTLLGGQAKNRGPSIEVGTSSQNGGSKNETAMSMP
jgi:hypothetical protein